MDFKKFDPKFDNSLEKTGPEFSEIHDLREKFALENRGKFFPIPKVPRNIEGLTPLNGRRVPATRRWWLKTSSFERNGFFNMHTHVFNTKVLWYGFVFFLVWGWVQPIVHGRWVELYSDNDERRNVVYDKLSKRNVPYAKIWSRPT